MPPTNCAHLWFKHQELRGTLHHTAPIKLSEEKKPRSFFWPLPTPTRSSLTRLVNDVRSLPAGNQIGVWSLEPIELRPRIEADRSQLPGSTPSEKGVGVPT